MLSRVAERMYWAGRYSERVEAMARLVRTHTALLLDLPEDSGSNWTQLLRIINAEADFAERYPSASERHVVTYLLADTDNPGSLLSCLAQLRENIRTSRDIVPREGWEWVNEFYLMVHGKIGRTGAQPKLRQDVLVDCVARCQRLNGLLAGTMSHGAGYNFMMIGSHF
ncbi:MAG: alpha-E domain-containing protein, partial [Pseudomonadales bacterium]